MKKLVCPNCNEICEFDETIQTNECPHCHQQIETTMALNNTELYKAKLYKSAIQFYDNAYSFEESYKCYDELLKLEPNNLDFVLARLAALIKTSSLKKNFFNQIIEDFDNSEIVLENTTYIRIGHFFEEVMQATFHYQKELTKFYDSAVEKEKEVVLYDLLSLIKFYDFIFENISMFKDEEYVESIFITKEELGLNKEKLITFLRNKNNEVLFDTKDLDNSEIFVNNRRFKFSEFDIKNYEDVKDYALFKLLDNGVKSSYIIFALLAIFTVLASVGVILAFTIKPAWIGATIGIVFAVAFVITYIAYTKIRNRQIAMLNK